MKYKILTKEQIILSLDRLTRFKKTKEKYFRVFSDIIINNLIEPKFKKNDIEKMDFSLLAEYASEIFNASINKYTSSKNYYNVQKILQEYENSVFVNDEDTQKLLNNKINFNGALDLIPKDCPVNLAWLAVIARNNTIDIINLRKRDLLKYPIEKVLLVEGITEEILLPALSKYLGYDFYAKGIQVIAAGGKNQVVKMYYKLIHELKLPIFILLDKDAEENINQIRPRLREIDKIHLVSCGEFEDLLPKSLIIKTVNSHFENFLSISEEDLNIDMPTAKILEEIFKTKGLHEFKKADFAKLVREEISSDSDISSEIKNIINEIIYTNKTLDTEKCS